MGETRRYRWPDSVHYFRLSGRELRFPSIGMHRHSWVLYICLPFRLARNAPQEPDRVESENIPVSKAVVKGRLCIAESRNGVDAR
jgi:hypothetical protein